MPNLTFMIICKIYLKTRTSSLLKSQYEREAIIDKGKHNKFPANYTAG